MKVGQEAHEEGSGGGGGAAKWVLQGLHKSSIRVA